VISRCPHVASHERRSSMSELGFVGLGVMGTVAVQAVTVGREVAA
jgi:hypothetical protein